MKIRHLLAALICALAVAPGIQAQDAKPKAAPSDHEETELGDRMDKMNSAFRKLRKQIADPTKNADSLTAVAALKAGAEESLKFEPAWKSDLPAAERAKFVADFRAKMKDTIAEIGKLEDALKANNNEEAGKIFAKLGDMQKEAHKEFRKPAAKKG
jgi:hypothetical protein